MNNETLTRLEQFVEAASRPGLLGMPGKKLELQTQRDMKAYFAALTPKIIALKLETLNDVHAVKQALDNLLRKEQPQLKAAIELGFIKAWQVAHKMAAMQESDDAHDELGRFATTDSSAGKVGGGVAAGLFVGAAISFTAAKALIGTPYRKMNCSQFACKVTGHKKATAQELYQEGTPGALKDAKPGDIVAFPHGHVAVMTNKGLMDSTPDRGVGYTKQREMSDAWYQGQPHLISNQSQESVAEAADDLLPADISKLGDTGKKASEWAAENAAEFVQGLDDTTIDLIAGAIEDGIERQLGAPGTGQLIRQELEDMSVSRALTIATTEMNRAMTAATLDKLDSLDVGYKQWIVDADPCPICQENADVGAIPLDEQFPSGDDGPGAHPNCRCAVTGARAPIGEAEFREFNPNHDDKGEFAADGAEGKTASRKQVVSHILKSGGQDFMAKSYERGLDADKFELKSIPLPGVDVQTKEGNVKAFSKMTSKAPAIVMRKDGKVFDGNHRVQAARARGETHIMAYVPKGK